MAKHNNESKLSENSNLNHLEAIHGIRVTSRELDILACLVSGRRIKTIAGFLSIAPKTVETHIRNIMLKFDCNSQESIITFIENSGKLVTVKQHYLSILTKEAFAQSLKEIGQLIKKEVCAHVIISAETGELSSAFIGILEEYLKKVGITSCKTHNLTQEKVKENKNKILHIVCENTFDYYGASNEIDSSNDAGKIPQEIFLLISKEAEEGTHKIQNALSYIDFRDHQNYYLSFFELLEKLHPTTNLKNIISEFKKRSCFIEGLPQSSLLEHTVDETPSKKSQLKGRLGGLWRLKGQYTLLANLLTIVASILTIIFLIIDPLKLRANQETSGKIHHTISKTQSEEPVVVRSDLIIPVESVVLHRPQIINLIDNVFKGRKGIYTVALIGMGGAGKTILARQFVNQQKAKIIWESNAETEETLNKSFENLAQALAKTEEDKRTLKEQLDIKNANEREAKIILFVKEHLKLNPNWILIYDNVEKFSDIQKYFPHDSSTWGNGKIILTTRDSNIQYNNHVNSVIQLQELSPREKLKLFIKIMNNGDSSSFSRLEEIKKFLAKIPPFPLDVSIAAYYLKAMNAPPFKYLQYLEENNIDFSNVQENILKEEGDYIKTRYKIITLSLKQLLSTNKDFYGLLLFLSLLNSQSIPRDLLVRYKSDVLVDECIYNLKKYSFLTNESLSSPLGQTFSMHRSTQAIILAYLLKELHLADDRKLLYSIADTLERYIADIIEEENYEKMKLLVTHPNIFLSHSNLWSESIKGSLQSQVGVLYYYLNYYGCAKERLEYALIQFNKYDAENYTRIAQTLGYLGSIDRDLGHHEKARELLEQGLKIYQKHLSKNYIGIAKTLKNLGNAHRSLDHCEKAKQLLEQSLEIYQKHLPKNYVGIASTLNYLGNAYRYLGYYEKAKETLEKSIRIYKEKLPENRIGMAWTLSYLGNIYRLTGNYIKAENLLEESLMLFKKSSSGSIYEAWALTFLGNTFGAMGEYEKAKETLEKSIMIYRTHLPENQVGLSWVSAYLGNIYLGLDNYQKAKSLLEDCLNLYRRENFPNDHIYIVWASTYLGNVYKALGNYKKAKELLEQSREIYIRRYGKDHIETARIIRELGQIYFLEGYLEVGENYFREALEIFQKNKHSDCYKALEDLADLYLVKSTQFMQKGRRVDAQVLRKQSIDNLHKAVELVQNNFPKDSPHLIRINAKLKNL